MYQKNPLFVQEGPHLLKGQIEKIKYLKSKKTQDLAKKAGKKTGTLSDILHKLKLT